MKNHVRILLIVVGHFFFALVVVLLFGNFCFLRTTACPHLYKEYLSGVLVVALCYVNAFLLFPKLFEEGRMTEYLAWTFVGVLLSSFVEMAMILPDTFPTLNEQFPHSYALRIACTETFFVFMRNIAISSGVFCIKAIPFFYKQTLDRDRTLLYDFNTIRAKDSNNQKTTIHISAISFCQQKQNYNIIHLLNGNILFRYGSLGQLSNLICPDYAIQVSRDTIVTYGSIVNFSASEVTVKLQTNYMSFTVSEKYMDSVLKQGQLHVLNQENDKSETLKKNNAKHDGRKKNSAQGILNYIAAHPDCPASDIQRYRRISPSTVNRILKQLKDEGLIEYVGSKKTGGYRICQKSTAQDQTSD